MYIVNLRVIERVTMFREFYFLLNRWLKLMRNLSLCVKYFVIFCLLSSEFMLDDFFFYIILYICVMNINCIK